MISRYAPQLTFHYAKYIDIPTILPLFEEGAYLHVFSASHIEWFKQLSVFKRLLSAVSWRLFSKGLQNDGSHLLVAKSKNAVVAFALLETTNRFSTPRPFITIDALAVLPRFRRNGIGKAFLHWIIQSSPHPALLHCECAPDAKAMRLLASREGFKPKRIARPVKGGLIRPYLLELSLA